MIYKVKNISVAKDTRNIHTPSSILTCVSFPILRVLNYRPVRGNALSLSIMHWIIRR